jgi:general secretion pathway protein N
LNAKHWWAFVLVGIVAVVCSLVLFAPAGLADAALSQATSGRIRLANASGTFWQGEGRIVLVDPSPTAQTGAPTTGPLALAGLMLPGQFTWHLQALPLLLGLVDADISLDGMSKPLHLSGSFGDLRGSAASLDLPSVELGRLGSPWNTIRPSAAIGLRWESFAIKQGLFEGKMAIELRDAASVMCPVRPLGSYRIDVSGNGREADITLATLAGPLNLSGKGGWNSRTGLRFTAEAQPDASERDRLQAFLALLGRRDGDKVILKIGA